MILNADTIKEKGNIKNVVEKYTGTLKRSGVNWTACCPFHSEKTPSFVVNEAKGLATCFGACGTSWNPVNFVMEKEGCSYPEALRIVAGLSGITVEYKDRQRTDAEIALDKENKEKKESLYILNEAVLKHWQAQTDFPEVFCDIETRAVYVDVWGRPYKKETIERFAVCVAPDANDLTKNWKGLGLNKENLLHLGLIAKGEKNEYDAFRGRLIFPFYTPGYQGRVAGFGGRVDNETLKASGNKLPKYRNSPQSLIFEKGSLLYGLRQTRAAISKAGNEGRAFIVEGYTDLLTMVDFGFENVVATGGTALTLLQAELMKRSAKEAVILRDGDKAGLDAAMRDVEVLIEAGIIPKICIIPPGQDGAKEDPDSFLRKHTRRGFEALLADAENGIQDAVYWRIQQEMGDNPDINSKELGLKLASELLSKMDTYRRGQYTKTLVGSKWFNCHKNELDKRILDSRVSRESNDFRDVTPSQEQDIIRYGIYLGKGHPRKSEVYLKPNGTVPTPLTNFVIKPIYHIFSMSDPARKVEIQNEEGETYILDLHTDKFVSPDAFQKAVEAFGNFVFTGECRKSDYANIKRKLYAEMETVYRISTLGHHQMNFWTWSNGITLPDGRFAACLEDGRVNVDGKSFVVPGFDVEEAQRRYTDDAPNTDSHIKLFKYIEGDTFTFEQWGERMLAVHGRNGCMGIGFYLAALFRDLLFPKRFKGFPILDLFGPPQKGKSTLAWSLMAMFGIPRAPVNLNNFTGPGMNARMEQTQNALVWVDEYKNDADKWKLEILKQCWDGVGRERRSGEKTKSTEQTEVKNAVVISGQHLPTKDIALLTRCITLLFDGYDTTPEGLKAFKELQEMEMTGKLSQLTSYFQRHREYIDIHFDRVFDGLVSEVKLQIGDYLESRVIENHCIPLAIVACLEGKENFARYHADIPFTETLKGLVIELIKQQAKFIESEDESGDFFRRIASMLVNGKIRHGVHLIVSDETDVTLYDPTERKDIENEKGTWAVPHRLLFLHLELCHGQYQQDYKMATGTAGMSVTELKTYLEQNKHFLGTKKAKKFPRTGSTLSVYVFDLGEVEDDGSLNGGLSSMGISMAVSKVIMAQEDSGTAPAEKEEEKEEKKEDLPF